MKKILLGFSVLFFIVVYYGCSDDSVSEQKTVIDSRSYKIVPDTLDFQIKVENTTITVSRLDSNLQFTNIPKIIFDINPTNGGGDIILRNNIWGNIYTKHFTGYMSDSLTLSGIPWMSYFSITDYTGTLSIKLVRNN